MKTVNALRKQAQQAMQKYADSNTSVKVSQVAAAGFLALEGQADGTGISRAFRAYILGEAAVIVRRHNDIR